MAKKMKLCVPCAVKLRTLLGSSHELKKDYMGSQKITCEECGRRRYGGPYLMIRKERDE